MGYTKAFLMALKSYQNYPANYTVGWFPRKNIYGNQRYIGAYAGAYCAVYFGHISTGSSFAGVYFSSEQTQYVDDDTIYTISRASNISASVVSESYSGSTSTKMEYKYRYSVSNSGNADVVLRKIVVLTNLPCASTQFSNATTTSELFISYVKELDTPITVPAEGTAIIDVTVETDAVE